MKTDNTMKTVSAGLLFFNALLCVITICKADIELLQDSIVIYFFIDLSAVAAFILFGLGLLKEKLDLVKIGAFVAAGSYFLRLIKVVTWLVNYVTFYNICYTLGTMCTIAAFVFLAISLCNDSKGNQNVLVMILIAAGGFLELVYALIVFSNYSSWYKPSIFEYFFSGNYLMSINICAFVAIILMVLPNVTQGTVNTITSPVQSTITQTTQATHKAENTTIVRTEDEVIELIKQYKRLLDAEIITQEEFDEKKKELL